MGGCSSKPKTAEFEAAMESQEESEAARKSVEAERIGVDAGLKDIDKASEGGIQNAIVEEEHNYLCNMLAETEKHICAGFDAEGNPKAERQVLEDDRMNVKQLVDKEVNGDLFVKRQTVRKEPARSELLEDPILIKLSAPELKEAPVVSAIKTGTVNSLEEPFAFSKRSSEMQVLPVMSEYETSVAQKYISHDTGASHLQEKAFTVQNEFMTLGKDVCNEAEKTMVVQESVAPEDIDLQLQKDPLEEARKRAVNLESQEARHGQMLDSSPSQKKQVGMVELESQDRSKEAGKGVVELEFQKAVHENGGQRVVDSPRQKNVLEESKDCDITANGGCMLENHTEQRGREVMQDKSLLFAKDEGAKGEAIDLANLDACPNNFESLVVEHNSSLDEGVHEEQTQAKVVDEAACTFALAESFTRSHAEPISKDAWPMDNDLPKESIGEAVSDDSWYILEKVDVQNNGPLAVVSKEHNHVGLPKNADNVPRETSRTAVSCDDKVLSTPEVIVASEEKPGAQPVHVFDPVGVAFKNILAQEISAPDIDDVLEKLASEFERQESLARSNS